MIKLSDRLFRMFKSHTGSTMVRFFLLAILAISVLSEYNDDEDYIVNGIDARKYEFPYQGEFPLR